MKTQIRNVTLVPEGDGVDVKRLFPLHGFMNFDPFVLFDHFNIGPGRGFPEHPHRGFEAITYMFDGGMNHQDNLGNASFVTRGGAQRFTAGKGIVHSEMPAKTGNSNGIQLWINLPQKLKKIPPGYQQVNHAEFPLIKLDAGQVKIIVGEGSPLSLQTEVMYQHIKLEAAGSYTVTLPQLMSGIVYVTHGYVTYGSIQVNQQKLQQDQALFITAAEQLEFNATEASEFMFCAGVPQGEPIRQHGPYVD